MSESAAAAHTQLIDRMLQDLRKAKVNTWFDLGLFLDQLRDNRATESDYSGSADQFMETHAGAVARVGRAGSWQPELPQLTLPGAEQWPEFGALFEARLERGSDEYNALVGSVWSQTLSLVEALGAAISEQNIAALVVEDCWSQPRHLPLALAVVCVCEGLRMPVLAVHEELHEQADFDYRSNVHLGEVYSLVECLCPWDSPWAVQLAADPQMAQRLMRDWGLNPARILLQADVDVAQALRPIAEHAGGDGAHDPAVAALTAHRQATRAGEHFSAITRSAKRKYLSGLTELEYMVRLSSLIDPSAFRIEEKQLRGRIFEFANARLADAGSAIPDYGRLDFLAAVEYLFEYHVGNDDMVVDHSLSYRHRHLWHYPFRKLTEAELCGVVGKLACEAVTGAIQQELADCEALADFDANLERLLGGKPVLDHRQRLKQQLAGKRPLLWLPDSDNWKKFAEEADFLAQFALPTRASANAIRIFTRSSFASGAIKDAAAYRYLGEHPVWSEALKAGSVELIEVPVMAPGTHLQQLGEAGEAAMLAVKEAGGLVLSFGHGNCLALDLLDMESFRLGRCHDELCAAFMDLQPGDSYCLWVPAALRPSLAYPTPIQTPKQLSEALNSAAFKQACESLGEAQVLEQLAADADRYGTPVAELLQTMLADGASSSGSPVESNLLTGIHPNGAPWSGAYARIRAADGWQFNTVFAQTRSDTVMDLIEQFVANGGGAPALAWNGGYILNAELVGKLGLPEDYIGTPLGLLIDAGKVRSLPLFNKPALAFGKDGSIAIREAHIRGGITVRVPGGGELQMSSADHNLTSADRPVFFDLMYDEQQIPLQGRVAYRLGGNQIISVHENLESLALLPVGLTIAVPAAQAPAGWQAGAEVEFEMPGWDDVADAIEAGPKLVRDGQISIEMDQGGWKTDASIRTQAARLDYTHMRGPKIGVGLNADGDLLVVAINGRIRESVGATHDELARILLDMGSVSAMGFDPGGSVTLVVGGRQLNISPYNKGYMDNPWSLPPQPRFVGNAIVAVPRA